MNEQRGRICDDCPEHSKVMKVQMDRDLEQEKQWDKIGEVEKCANAAKRLAATKVGPGFVVLVLGIVATICLSGFTILYSQTSKVVDKMHEVEKRVVAIETKLTDQGHGH